MKAVICCVLVCLGFLMSPCLLAGVQVFQGLPYKPGIEMCVLDLSVPTAVTGFPTIVWFHGGGLTGGHRHFIDVDTNRIAVAAVEYRLMIYDDKGAVPNGAVAPTVILDDCAAAAAWVRERIVSHGGDARRVFVAGHSAGGYVTHLLGLDVKWLKPYGLTPFDFAGFLPISGQATKHFAVRQYYGEEKDQLRPIVDEWAPIHHIAARTPPFCLLLGDRRIEWPMRVEESEFMYLSMKAMGNKTVEFHSFPDTNHGTCVKPSLVQMMKFVDAH